MTELEKLVDEARRLEDEWGSTNPREVLRLVLRLVEMLQAEREQAIIPANK